MVGFVEYFISSSKTINAIIMAIDESIIVPKFFITLEFKSLSPSPFF